MPTLQSCAGGDGHHRVAADRAEGGAAAAAERAADVLPGRLGSGVRGGGFMIHRPRESHILVPVLLQHIADLSAFGIGRYATAQRQSDNKSKPAFAAE